MTVGLALTAGLALGQPQASAPPLEDFVAATNPDDKIAQPALARLALTWRDDYTALLVDLTRFFRGTRPSSDAASALVQPAK